MCKAIFTTAFSLFILMDSIGNIPVYFALLSEIPRKRRLWIVFRENIIALVTILLFAFFGKFLLKSLCISHESIYVAGGCVLFLIALRMIFPEHNGSLAHTFATEGEPIIFPLAIPLIAGPSVLAAVMIYSTELVAPMRLLCSIIIAWAFSTGVLLGASYLQNFLGLRTIKALERLMGLILILISINMVLHGVRLFQMTQNTMPS